MTSSTGNPVGASPWPGLLTRGTLRPGGERAHGNFARDCAESPLSGNFAAEVGESGLTFRSRTWRICRPGRRARTARRWISAGWWLAPEDGSRRRHRRRGTRSPWISDLCRRFRQLDARKSVRGVAAAAVARRLAGHLYAEMAARDLALPIGLRPQPLLTETPVTRRGTAVAGKHPEYSLRLGDDRAREIDLVLHDQVRLPLPRQGHKAAGPAPEQPCRQRSYLTPAARPYARG